jgi:hypothetical protein
MSAKWFPRLGDIPGVEYSPPVNLDRKRIPGHDVRPEVVAHTNIHGEPDFFLMWPREGTTWRSVNGWAPVREHLLGVLDQDRTPTAQLLRGLWEALELPGEPVDYHWILRDALDRLWRQRWTEPSVLATFESLAWIDVRLVLAFPRETSVLVRPMEGGESYMRRSTPFETLIQLYRTEGFLRTAVELAELEREHFPVEEDDLIDIRSRLEAVRAESRS